MTIVGTDVELPFQLNFCRLTSTSDQISLTIKMVDDFSWSLQVYGHPIESHTCSILSAVPQHLVSAELVGQFALQLEHCSVCPGNSDEKFFSLAAAKKGTFMSHTGEYACLSYAYFNGCVVVTYLLCYHEGYISCIGSEVVARTKLHPYKTICHCQCELLVKSGKCCSSCESHRSTL